MGDLFKLLTIINLLIALGDENWQVAHKTDDGEFKDLGKGSLSFHLAGAGYLVKAEYDEGGTHHHLRGEAKIVNFRVRESIRQDEQEVDKDDITVSPHFAGNAADTIERVTVEFKFRKQNETATQNYRFEKSVV